MTAPGWYKDPADPDVQRYWDGEGWVGDPVPASAPAPAGPPPAAAQPAPAAPPTGQQPGTQAPPIVTTPGTPLPQGAVVLPPGTPVPPGGFPPGQLPPGAIVLPPGTPLPPGLQPQGTLPASAVQVLLPPQAGLPNPAAIRPHGHALAPLGSRLLARLIDILMVGLLSAAVTGWFIYRYVSEFGPVFTEIARRQEAGEPVDDLVSGGIQSQYVVILIIIAALWFAYEVPAIAGGGQTLGKRLMKIKVVGLDSDQPIGFARAIRRWNPLGLSVLLWGCCGLGLLLQFVDSLSPVVDWPMHRAFHDRSAGTVVVLAEPSTAPENPGDQR